MSADFLEKIENPSADPVQRLIALDMALTELKAKGMTFFRVSTRPDEMESGPVYVEGWRERPAEQGPHPWEAAR